MSNFSEIIAVNEDELFFNFNAFSIGDNHQFKVTVALSGSSSVSFSMKKSNGGQWNIHSPAPKWIVNMEPKLSKVIAAHI